MTLEEFRRLADTWGGDIERWPAPRQGEARRHAATEEGASILADAQRLDALLAREPDVTPERAGRVAFAVVQRIAAEDEGGLRHPAWLIPNWRPPNWLMPAAGVACSALIGISLATMMPYRQLDEPTSVLSAILDTGSMATSWVTR
jgi:hypothetical protein